MKNCCLLFVLLLCFFSAFSQGKKDKAVVLEFLVGTQVSVVVLEYRDKGEIVFRLHKSKDRVPKRVNKSELRYIYYPNGFKEDCTPDAVPTKDGTYALALTKGRKRHVFKVGQGLKYSKKGRKMLTEGIIQRIAKDTVFFATKRVLDTLLRDEFSIEKDNLHEGKRIDYKKQGDFIAHRGRVLRIKSDTAFVLKYTTSWVEQPIAREDLGFIQGRAKNKRWVIALGWILVGLLFAGFFVFMLAIAFNSLFDDTYFSMPLTAGAVSTLISGLLGLLLLISLHSKKFDLQEKWKPEIIVLEKVKKA